MGKVQVFGPFDPPPETVIVDYGPSKTKQSEAESCDVNRIMARFEKTGELPVVVDPGYFADVSEVGDYLAVQERLREATTLFAQLPLKTREKFGNEPAAFVDFISDAKNVPEFAALGIQAVSVETGEVLEQPAPVAPVKEPAPVVPGSGAGNPA